MVAERERDAGIYGPNGSGLDFTVRRSRRSDTRAFVELYRTVAAEQRYIRTESVRSGTRYYRKQMARSWQRDAASLVAVAGGRVVGHLSISREEHPVTRHVASIGMMVAPEWRGRGVGSALLELALEWAREMRVEKVALSVYPDNDAARALYRRFGFVEEGRLTGHSKKRIGYRDEIVMGLWLVDPPSTEA